MDADSASKPWSSAGSDDVDSSADTFRRYRCRGGPASRAAIRAFSASFSASRRFTCSTTSRRATDISASDISCTRLASMDDAAPMMRSWAASCGPLVQQRGLPQYASESSLACNYTMSHAACPHSCRRLQADCGKGNSVTGNPAINASYPSHRGLSSGCKTLAVLPPSPSTLAIARNTAHNASNTRQSACISRCRRAAAAVEASGTSPQSCRQHCQQRR